MKGQRNRKTVVKELFYRELEDGRMRIRRANKRDWKAARKELGKPMKMQNGYWRGRKKLFFTSLL
jgi:hypothetical protein